MRKCSFCGSEAVLEIDSFKRKWFICRSCRCAESDKKERYPLDWLEAPLRYFLRQKKWSQTEDRLFKHSKIGDDATKPWDHFLTPEYVKVMQSWAEKLYRNSFVRHGFEVKDKSILELSGGSGDVVHYLKSVAGGGDVVLSEYNTKVIEQAKERLGIPAFFYDCNAQTLREAMREGLDEARQEMKFDYIVARWLVMFSLDIESFLRSCMECLKDDGRLIIEGSVMTTEGPMMRTQFDEFTYLRLYSPEYLEQIFKKLDLVVTFKEKSLYDDMYIYTFDRYPLERHIYLYYEYKMNNQFAKFDFSEYDRLEFNAREMRSWSFILQKGESWRS